MDGTRGTAAPAGSAMCVTALVELSHSQALLPFLMTSLSVMLCGTASRKCAGSENHTLIVCAPASSDGREAGSPVGGSAGRPSDAVSTTVPVSGGADVLAASAASSCAGVRDGSSGAAWAAGITDPASTPPATATAPAGTAHRTRRGRFTLCFMMLRLSFRSRKSPWPGFMACRSRVA